MSGGPVVDVAQIFRLLHTMEAAESRAKYGTAPGLRRAIMQLPEGHANASTLAVQYARVYRSALAESSMAFLHLSKSGGTALCELAKLNGCSRAGAGQSTFSGNCVNRQRFDGPWWLPDETLRKIRPDGLRQFAQNSFRVAPSWVQHQHDCRGRSRSGDSLPSSVSRRMRRDVGKPPVFFAIEGAVPEVERCPGMLELLVLREPLRRLASFGRELARWGLLPRDAANCEALQATSWRERREKCEALKARVCANFSKMALYTPPVYDNQLTRTLLGPEVYRRPMGAITRGALLSMDVR